MEIGTMEHNDQFSVSCAIRKATDMQMSLYKARTDLKFCTSCGVGDHSLEDCPTILDKINKKKNVNVLSRVKKCDIIHTKNLHVVTRQGTKTGNDNPRIRKIKTKMIILIP